VDVRACPGVRVLGGVRSDAGGGACVSDAGGGTNGGNTNGGNTDGGNNGGNTGGAAKSVSRATFLKTNGKLENRYHLTGCSNCLLCWFPVQILVYKIDSFL